jgi:signal peptidase I
MTAWPVAVACVLAFVASGLLWVRSRYVLVSVAGQSMVPSFHHGDRVLVRRTVRRSPRIGEVAVLRLSRSGARGRPTPNGRIRLDRTRWVIKRVAALPGDAVPESVRAAVGGVPVVPDGMLVLLGDNPHGSKDSRSWGFVPAADLLGKVVARTPVGRSGIRASASGLGDRSRPARPRPAARRAVAGRRPPPG